MRGVAAVELALVSIPMVLLSVAAVDFARAMFTYDQLVKSARDGARYLSFFDPSIAAEYPTALARSRMVYGMASPPAGTPTIVPGLTTAMIAICDRTDSSSCPGETFANVPTGSGNVNLVKVTISGYQFTPIFPGGSRLTAFTFEPISVTMRQLY
ncbi:TadE family protein [Zoogloea sp.]|uniref:TadE/TadG family type IV pilus assembly protein n=1 Tax=Zoogloea sp. TaxID=49181 RepID=UPI0031FC1D89